MLCYSACVTCMCFHAFLLLRFGFTSGGCVCMDMSILSRSGSSSYMMESAWFFPILDRHFCTLNVLLCMCFHAFLLLIFGFRIGGCVAW